MKYFSAFIFLLLPLLSFAQKETNSTVEIDTRLYEVFEPSYLERLQKQNPFLIQRWNFYLDHAFYITKDDKAAKNKYPIIEIKDLNDINILKIEREQVLERFNQKESSYQIKGTDKVLVYHASRTFNKNLNEYLGRKAK